MNRRPRLELVGASASPAEVAAVMAAVERFMRDTAPPPVQAAPPPGDAWRRAARLEAVQPTLDATALSGDPWVAL